MKRPVPEAGIVGDDCVDIARANMDRAIGPGPAKLAGDTTTIGDIAKEHGVTVHEAAQALPMTPRHGAFPANFGPLPPPPKPVVRPAPKPITRTEAHALVGEIERLTSYHGRDCDKCGYDLGAAPRSASVLLDAAIDKLRRLADP